MASPRVRHTGDNQDAFPHGTHRTHPAGRTAEIMNSLLCFPSILSCPEHLSCCSLIIRAASIAVVRQDCDSVTSQEKAPGGRAFLETEPRLCSLDISPAHRRADGVPANTAAPWK